VSVFVRLCCVFSCTQRSGKVDSVFDLLQMLWEIASDRLYVQVRLCRDVVGD
jgi:hypothetical protein